MRAPDPARSQLVARHRTLTTEKHHCRQVRPRPDAANRARTGSARTSAASDRVGAQQCVDAAVDEQDRSVDVAGIGAEEELDRGGDLIG